MTFGWSLALAAAVLFPGHLSGPFDGVPFDTGLKAVVLGVVLPALWWWHAEFLRTRFARAAIVALLTWKVLTSIFLVPDGWCVRFVPSAPVTKDETGVPHSWDVRADWRSANPRCSALMTRPYGELSEFPAWFFNLPPADDNLPGATDRPPGATTTMTVSGFLRPRSSGTLGIVTGPDVSTLARIDGGTARVDVTSGEEAARDGLRLTPAVHAVVIEAKLTGDRWRFAPLWNGGILWPGSIATTARPSRLDVAVRPWGNWVTPGLVGGLVLAWVVSVLARIRNVFVLAWTVGASCCLGLIGAAGRIDLLPWSIGALALAAWLPLPARLRNAFGAFLLIGVPWLTLIVVVAVPTIGRFTMYSAGDDWWTFQRYAYRIVLQGYWLEGGQRTFWFQPFYRWIAGFLHLAFGDSSAGEWYWDGACLLVTASFSFHVADAVAGFKWGVIAAVTTLVVVANGPAWVFIGRGLSEISSAGFVYLAALCALRSRRGPALIAITAGVLATLAFYTRLNNLPMVFAVVSFSLPLSQPVRDLWRPAALMRRASMRTLVALVVTLSMGLVLFAWRTWHYTGVFSLFYGTSLYRNALWQPGMSIETLARRMASSVITVLTMNDPPRFDLKAAPLVLGGAFSVLALAGVGWLRELPLPPVLFCLAALAGSLVARAEAYPGRFSIHIIAMTTAIVVSAAAITVQRSRMKWSDRVRRM